MIRLHISRNVTPKRWKNEIYSVTALYISRLTNRLLYVF
jgi:hypothetical protein